MLSLLNEKHLIFYPLSPYSMLFTIIPEKTGFHSENLLKSFIEPHLRLVIQYKCAITSQT